MDWLKKHIKGVLIGFISMILTSIGTYIIVVFNKGLEADTKEFIVNTVTELVQSRDFMEEKVMNSPYMKEKEASEKLRTIAIVTQKVDSNQIDYISVMAIKAGMSKKAFMDTLVSRTMYNTKINKEEIEKLATVTATRIVRKEVKVEALNKPSF